MIMGMDQQMDGPTQNEEKISKKPNKQKGKFHDTLRLETLISLCELNWDIS